MKVLITLAGTALSQTVLPETLPFGEGFGEYDLGDYSLGDYGLGTNQDPDVPYALLDSLADDPDAVVDYFESEDPTGRNAGGGRKPLPPGIFYRDYIRPNGTFDVQAFRQAIREAQAAQAAAEAQNDQERYFFTNPSTTSTTTTTTSTTKVVGNSCWKCDQMSYSDCSTKGDIEQCQKGDKDCCFVEIREQAQKLQQLCTGCKSRVACENLRDENSHFDTSNVHVNEKMFQCRPDYRQQLVGKHAAKQSVCRQCFNTCDPSDTNDAGAFCFGGSNTKGGHNFFALQHNANQQKYPWKNYYKQTDSASNGMGIPIAKADGTLDAGIIADIVAMDPANLGLNIYFQNPTDGKVAVTNTDGTRDANEMLYWGLQGADRAWWASDLKTKSSNARSNGPTRANLA